jgi:hypothetical protein
MPFVVLSGSDNGVKQQNQGEGDGVRGHAAGEGDLRDSLQDAHKPVGTAEGGGYGQRKQSSALCIPTTATHRKYKLTKRRNCSNRNFGTKLMAVYREVITTLGAYWHSAFVAGSFKRTTRKSTVAEVADSADMDEPARRGRAHMKHTG